MTGAGMSAWTGAAIICTVRLPAINGSASATTISWFLSFRASLPGSLRPADEWPDRQGGSCEPPFCRLVNTGHRFGRCGNRSRNRRGGGIYEAQTSLPMRFTPAFLDEIRDRVPISSVIGPRVTWDRRKTNAAKGDYWACCPFHGEKSPSFHC